LLNINNPEHYSWLNPACRLPVIRWFLKTQFRNAVLLWYWNEEKNYINFGDYTTSKLLEEFGYKTVEYSHADALKILDRYEFCLLGAGSCLNKNFIDLFNVRRVYVWGQGKGIGDYFDIEKEPYCSKVKIFAVRGPHTIRQLNLNKATPLGDPAFLMPLFFKIKRNPSQYKITYLPHWSNRKDWDIKKGALGAERFVDIICNRRKFWPKLNEIVSSSFVLTNSLHGAIICHAYKIPWALCLAEGDGLNFPDKWRDFFEYLGINEKGIAVKNYKEGLDWWNTVGSKAKTRDLSPLLDSFPLPIKNKKVRTIINKVKSERAITYF
jgi:hypothetical protein